MKKIKQLEPMEIEKRSFEIISHELSDMQITLPADQEMITKRVIHTSADFDYIQTLKYSKNAVAIAKRLISEGADIVTDTNMALSGINKKYLAKAPDSINCGCNGICPQNIIWCRNRKPYEIGKHNY